MDRMVEEFKKIYGAGGAAPRLFAAAGRVNLIGEHIDYNGGLVFPAALTLGCRIAARLNGTDTVNIAFTTAPLRAAVELSRIDEYKTAKYVNYQAGVCSVLRADGAEISGCDLLYDIDVPFGAGLSSSAAIEVATAFMLTTFSNEQRGIRDKIDLVRLAKQARRAENEYIGVNCGIMDQFASALGRADNAILLNCATLDYQYIPLRLPGYSLVIVDTNKPHSLAASKYNERRAECAEALALLQRETGAEHLCGIQPEAFEAVKGVLPGVLLRRAAHCVYEQARVTAAADAMRAGDIAALGGLLKQSHESLRRLYEVSCEELDVVADFANSFSGCAGARMTGAGFGGSCVALVRADAVADFTAALARTYTRATGLAANIYSAGIGDGAREIVL